MFNRPTVFIVGAGASAECSLPTGAELKKKISVGAKFPFEFSRQIVGDQDLLYALKSHFRGSHEQMESFSRAGNDLAETISTFASIDEALHWWRARPEIVEIGKVAVAHYILDAERNCVLGNNRKTGRVDVDLANQTWLHCFMSIALAGLDRESAPFAFKNVTIINFNYDRTIEQYIYWALQQRAGVERNVAAQAVSNLRMIRPYGSIGKLDWNGQHEVEFGMTGGDVFSISRNIRTFTEQIEEVSIAEGIDEALEAANLIVLLGFGFHQQNLDLFERKVGKTRGAPKTVIATAFGLDERNYPILKNRLNNLMNVPTPMLFPLKSNALMVELRPTIEMAAA